MLHKIARFYNNFEEIFLVICIAAMVVVIFVQVVMRYLFNSSLSWSEELARIIFIWASWIGISFGEKRGEHIKITLLTDKLKGKAKEVVVFFADLCTLAIIFVLLIKGFAVVESVANTGSLTPSVSMPKWVVYASVPISCGLMSVRVIWHMILTITGKREEER